MTEKDKKPFSKTKETQPNSRFYNYTLFIFVSLTTWFLVLFLYLPPAMPTNSKQQDSYSLHETKSLNSININNHNHSPFSVYIYNLPPEFNFNLLKNCSHLNIYSNMCPHVANRGLGQPLPGIAVELGFGLGLGGTWFATHQFIAEMIFHARMENHPFRTRDPSRATLFYVPFYGGLHASSKFREANHTVRDELAVRLEEFLRSQPWWERHRGKDHFMVLGRTAWDFMRTPGGTDFGANCLLNLPRVRNMSVMTVERQPWKGSNLHGIPYPSYFHPSTSQQMLTWQNKIRQLKRPHLFTFIGAPRKGVEIKAAIRNELIRQCGESTRCNLVSCISSQGSSKCYKPSEVIKAMSSSDFCLQAPGDSFTRRSTFDSVLAGCIPVFFSPHTAYTQYGWFLPVNGEENSYSVYIDGEKGNTSAKIEEELMKIPRERVERMRNKVIDLIPRVTYKHPNASDNEAEFKDAVDVTVAALAKQVQKIIL